METEARVKELHHDLIQLRCIQTWLIQTVTFWTKI